jgi:hypothetical protein
MATTTTTTEAKLVKLWARVEAATVNSVTGEVTHTPGVDPKYLAAELVREIQGLSQQLDAEKAKVADLTAKLEAATKATAKATTGKKRLTIPADDVDTATGTDI